MTATISEGLDTHRSWGNQGPSTQPDHESYDAELSPAQKLAKDAVTRFFNWILEAGVNNPGYTTSQAFRGPMEWLTANRSAIQNDIVNRLGDLTKDHMTADTAQFWRFYNATKMQRDMNGNPVPVPKMFEATEIAYAGIADIIARGHHYTLDAPIETINADTVNVIGATYVRSHYMRMLDEERPGAITFSHLSSLGGTYQQNIISAIQRAALLTAEAERLAVAADAPENVIQLPMHEPQEIARDVA